MPRTLPILIVILGLNPILTHASVRHSAKPEAVALYQTAQELLALGDTSQAIKVLEKCVREDRKYAEGYFQLGLCRMSRGTIRGRFRAKRALEKALRLSPGNTDFRHGMARLMLASGMYWEAARQFKRILKHEPEDSEALFQLGLIKERDLMHYRDMIDPDPGGGIIYFQDFANEDLREAADYYQRVLEVDPAFSEAYYRLGLLMYEVQDYGRMAEIIELALERDAKKVDYYLFLGLANHRMGEDELAHQHFQSARELMSPELRAVFDDVEQVMTPKQVAALREASGDERSRLTRGFWMQRDPIFLTDYNERVLEHYGRIAYANLRYTRPRLKQEGWRTDRGKVLIRFGEPAWRVRTRPWVSVGGRGNSVHHSIETWRYEDFYLQFEDRYLGGNYAFKWGIRPEFDSRYQFEQRIKKAPDRYEHDFQDRRFELVAEVARFRGDNGNTQGRAFFGFPKLELGARPRVAGDQWVLGVFLFDEAWEPVLRDREPVGRHLRFLEEGDSTALAVGAYDIEAPPDSYLVAIELMNRRTGRVGTCRHSVRLRAFPDSGLVISDVLLGPRADSFMAKSQSSMYPSFQRPFRIGAPAGIYYEVYNIAQDSTGFTHFTVVTEVERALPKGNLLSRTIRGIGRVFGRNREFPRVSTTYGYTGDSATERIGLSLSLESLRPGPHLISLRVTDQSGAEAGAGARLELR